MAMNSNEGTQAHSHGNMVAQPVDTITTAAQSSPREAMSAATIESGKEANAELSDFDISEDSPAKDTSALHVSTNKYRWHRLKHLVWIHRRFTQIHNKLQLGHPFGQKTRISFSSLAVWKHHHAVWDIAFGGVRVVWVCCVLVWVCCGLALPFR